MFWWLSGEVLGNGMQEAQVRLFFFFEKAQFLAFGMHGAALLQLQSLSSDMQGDYRNLKAALRRASKNLKDRWPDSSSC